MLGFFTGDDEEDQSPEQKAREMMSRLAPGHMDNFNAFLANQAQPSGGYAPATPMPSGMNQLMPQQPLLSGQQSYDVGAAMKSPREQAAAMIGNMGGRDQTAEFNTWMDRDKMAAAEQIRRLGGDSMATDFLSKPPEYYDVGGPLKGWSQPQPQPQPQPSPARQSVGTILGGMIGGGMRGAATGGMNTMRPQQPLEALLPVGPPQPQPPMPDDPVRITGGSGGGYVSSYNPAFRADPFMAKDSFMADGPIQSLGVNGFRTGSSMPTYDDSGMRQRAGIDRYNMQLGSMLGNQDIARASNQNDLMRTLLGVQSRNDIASDRETGRFLGLIDKIPEGNRTPAIEEAVRKGAIDKTVGSEMLMNEMLTRAKRAGKTDKGIDTGKFLGSLAAEFDPGRMSKADLIKKIQQMGYSADQLAAFENDPVVGPMVRSILGPAVPYQTTGLDAIMKDVGSGKFWQDAKNTPGAIADSFMNLFR